MHYPEDTTSWLSAKTVWKSMQMRAQEVSMKTGTKSIFRTLPYILHVRPLLAQKFMHLCTMQMMFHLIVLTFYWTSVKTVKCTSQSSVDRSFRSPGAPVDFIANLSQYKIFHDFMHMRAKTICEFTAEYAAVHRSYSHSVTRIQCMRAEFWIIRCAQKCF